MKIEFHLSTGSILEIEAQPSERLMHVITRLFDENPKDFISKDLNYCLVNGQKANLIKSLEENKITNGTSILLVLSEEEDYFSNSSNSNLKEVVDTFKSELSKINFENDKKKINFEIKTGDPKGGISFELFTIETKEFCKYINMNIDYIKHSFSVLSIQFKVKDLESEKIVKEFYNKWIEDHIFNIFARKKLNDLSINYRAEGTNIFIEVVSQKGKYIKPILSFGLDPSKLGEYFLSMGFKTNIKVSDLFLDKTYEEIASLFYCLNIYFKAESKNLGHVVDAVMKAMDKLNLTNKRYQYKLEKYLRFISVAMDLVSSNTEIKVTPKYVIKETVKRLEVMNFKNQMAEFKKMILESILWSFISDVLKGIILDSIDICSGIPKKQIGLLACLRFPGLSSVLDNK